MSAHLCLTAWYVPIGLPKATRILAYSVERSSTFCAPPHISAQSATAARSSTRASDRPSLVERSEERVGSDLDALERHLGELPRLVHRRQERGRDALPVRRDEEEAHAVGRVVLRRSRGPRGHDEEVRRVAVGHEELRAGEDEAPGLAGLGGDLDARGVPAGALLEEGERRPRLARGDAGEPRLRCASEPASRIASPPRSTVEKNGPGMTARPISSSTTVRSTSPRPIPPSASG